MIADPQQAQTLTTLIPTMVPLGYYVVQGVNILTIAGFAWSMLKIGIPVGLSVRDSLRDTANELRELRRTKDDHEDRLRAIERAERPDFHGQERRTTQRRN